VHGGRVLDQGQLHVGVHRHGPCVGR
jgi:hypothetical protein